ncbi:DUF1343 domain-containing protein [Balneolales bacterium ANBcel1]|nr:DUF1343 domain-containing protein [Balneolales bacterium ANBcel1]
MALRFFLIITVIIFVTACSSDRPAGDDPALDETATGAEAIGSTASPENPSDEPFQDDFSSREQESWEQAGHTAGQDPGNESGSRESFDSWDDVDPQPIPCGDAAGEGFDQDDPSGALQPCGDQPVTQSPVEVSPSELTSERSSPNATGADPHRSSATNRPAGTSENRSMHRNHTPGSGATTRTGLDVLIERDFDLLQGKRVGLITNATGVDQNLTSVVDLFHHADAVDLVALFGPEHGVRGDYDAGAYVESYTDERTGLPVFSLYGPTRKPTGDMLSGIDVLVFDIQDIGVRSYTYISTMGLSMAAAAQHDIAYVVLDRPNPLGGERVEGNIARHDHLSFVSPFPIPYVHSLTVGELAGMLNGEGMLENGVQVDLSVVPMENWRREMLFGDTGLHWVPTSPHIPRAGSPLFYVMTGITGELQQLSEGVGYTLPFEVFGAEWIDGVRFAERLNERGLPGLRFRPVSWRPFYGRDEGKRLEGVQIHVSDGRRADLMAAAFHLLEVHHELYPEKNPFERAGEDRLRMFDLVAGSPEIRKRFMESMRYEYIRGYLEKDREAFRERSKEYRLYE